MLHEKKKILTHRLIWLTLLILGIVIPLIISNVSKNKLDIIDDNCYLTEYYEAIDETTCEVEVVFNCKITSGHINVAFYDSRDKLLATEKGFFIAYDNIVSSTFFIDGKVDSYEILSYEVILSNGYEPIFMFIEFFFFIFFISSLFLSYKEYEYNGNNIVVYAGFYHHYIKVNGYILDEHNTLISYTAIPLSCRLNDNTDIKVTISMTNRISLKINDQLYRKK